MKMDQPKDEINKEQSAEKADLNFLDRMLAATDEQINLCTAALLIYQRSEVLQGLSHTPEIIAMNGIISAIHRSARHNAEELEIVEMEEALKALRPQPSGGCDEHSA